MNYKKIPIAIICLIIPGGIFTYLWYNQDIYINRKPLLIKTVTRYQSLIEVNACKEAYEYLSDSSKQQTPYDKYLDWCKLRQTIKKEGNLSMGIKDIVTLRNGYVRVNFNIKIKPLENEKEISIDKAETWLIEKGKWKRDYPN